MKSTRSSAPSSLVIEHLVEGSWLAALVLVPVVLAAEGTIAGTIQGPKIFVFRSIVFFLFACLLFSFAGRPWVAELRYRSLSETGRLIIQSIRSNPLLSATTAVLGANLISYAFSPVRNVSWGGVEPGFDNYGLLNILCFMILFVALVTHLRSQAQLRRLLWVSASTIIIISAYGFVQHLGYDPVQNAENSNVRLLLTFGNPIFGAAYLLIGIPLLLVLWETYRIRMEPALHMGFGVVLMVLPLFAMAYSLSRGAMISLSVALIVYLVVSAYTFGLRSVRRPTLVIAVSLFSVVLMGFLPTHGNMGNADLGERVGSIGGAFTPDGGGLSGRYSIWETAVDAYITVPWPNNAEHSELPAIGIRPLRWLVGYGQDTFGISYRLVDGGTKIGVLERNGHNFLIHSLLELGVLGALAYAWLAAVVLYTLGVLIRQAHRKEIYGIIPFLAVGLSAVFVGRFVEQMAGKAQVSDLTFIWVLTGVLAALTLPGRFTIATHGNTGSMASAHYRKPIRRSAKQTESPSALRYVTLALATLTVLVFWWIGPFADIRALSLSGQAQRAGSDGQAERAGLLYQQAIEVAPHASIPRLLLAQGLLNGARIDPDAGSTLMALETARNVIQEMLDRNPMDVRAYELAASISQEIASIDATQWERAVHEATLVVKLSPGLWEMLPPLAWALAQAGDNDGALEAVHLAQEQGAGLNPSAYILYYIESKIETNRGNVGRANTALETLKTFSHPDVPFLVEDAGG